MHTSIKKNIMIIALLLLVGTSVFADDDTPLYSTSFKLKHVVNVKASYHFEFWDPASDKHITEATMDTAGRHVFATLVIVYNSMVTVPTVSVEFTDLVNTEGLFYPYQMEVLKPNDSAHYVEITLADGKHGAGSCVLFNAKSFSMYDTSKVWNTDEICDFAITFDDSDVSVGTYSGTIKYTIEPE